MAFASGGSSKSNVCLLRPPANVFFVTHTTHRPKGPAKIQSAAPVCWQPPAEGGWGGAERRVIVTGTGHKQFFIF